MEEEVLVRYDSRDAELEQALTELGDLSGRDLQCLTGLDRRTIDRVRQRGAASPRVREAIVAGALAMCGQGQAQPAGPTRLQCSCALRVSGASPTSCSDERPRSGARCRMAGPVVAPNAHPGPAAGAESTVGSGCHRVSRVLEGGQDAEG